MLTGLAQVSGAISIKTVSCEKIVLRSLQLKYQHKHVEELKLKYKMTPLEISHHISPNAPGIITADPQRLRQILDNLINNAIKTG